MEAINTSIRILKGLNNLRSAILNNCNKLQSIEDCPELQILEASNSSLSTLVNVQKLARVNVDGCALLKEIENRCQKIKKLSADETPRKRPKL